MGCKGDKDKEDHTNNLEGVTQSEAHRPKQKQGRQIKIPKVTSIKLLYGKKSYRKSRQPEGKNGNNHGNNNLCQGKGATTKCAHLY